MSYCRWSTDIKNTVPWHEELKLYKEGNHYEDIKALRELRGGETSDWYIFDNCNDLASIWHLRDTIDWDYDDLLEAYLTDTIQDSYSEPTQIEYLYEIVYEVLEEHFSEDET